jgi:hypothetical protein
MWIVGLTSSTLDWVDGEHEQTRVTLFPATCARRCGEACWNNFSRTHESRHGTLRGSLLYVTLASHLPIRACSRIRSSVGPKHRSQQRWGRRQAARTAGTALGRRRASRCLHRLLPLRRRRLGGTRLAIAKNCIISSIVPRATVWRHLLLFSGCAAAAFATVHGSLDSHSLLDHRARRSLPATTRRRRRRRRTTAPPRPSAKATLLPRALGAAPLSPPPPSTRLIPSAHHGRSWPGQPAHHQCVSPRPRAPLPVAPGEALTACSYRRRRPLQARCLP